MYKRQYYNRDQTNQAAPLTDFLQDMAQGGWGDTNGEIKFWKAFPEGPRKDATYFPKIILSDGELHDWWYEMCIRDSSYDTIFRNLIYC